MNVVTVHDSSGKKTPALRHIKKILLQGLKKLKLRNMEVNVTLVSDRVMKSLNRKYRGKNKPTDVLSFSQNDMTLEKRVILGDIVIARETSARQAAKAGHTINEEYAMLSVHGLLHLLGYDHERKKDEAVMFSLQDQLLKHVQ